MQEKNKEQQEAKQSSKKAQQTLKGGVIVEDLVEGSGPPAKNGRFITVSNSRLFYGIPNWKLLLGLL